MIVARTASRCKELLRLLLSISIHVPIPICMYIYYMGAKLKLFNDDAYDESSGDKAMWFQHRCDERIPTQ